MFTVLIAEKEHIDAIRQENKLFFEPFLDNKELSLCYWNPQGQNLIDSVPGLLDAVGRRKDWRAVIIADTKGERLKMRNPFDVVNNSAVTALNVPEQQLKQGDDFNAWVKQWEDYYANLAKEKEAVYKSAMEQPLQKLTTWLCFKPEDYILNEVVQKQDVNDWAMEKIRKDSQKPSERLEQLEREQYKKDLRAKELIRREIVGQNYLNIAYPAEVHCISLRTAENSFFDPENYWSVRQDCEYSAFADRNMYFDKMRFMVFDLLPQTHRNFRTDYIRFLASVLIFVSNPVPGSAMQARRLYQFETETDDSPLCTLVTSYDRKLAATSEVIDGEMERIRGEIPGELTDKAAEALFCTPTEVTVVLDKSCNPEKVLAENDYGLFFDHPVNEYDKWNRSYDTSKEALSYIVKQQARAIRKSVGRLNDASEITDVNVSRLTPYQIDDVREHTNASENEMVDSIPPDLSDITRYTKRLSNESEKVKKTISQRMTKKTTVVLSILCLALYFVCFLPFLLSNNSTPRTVATAVGLCAAMMGILAGIMIGTLFVLRMAVKNSVRSYNNTANGILAEIQASLKKFSKYMSASCNVRRGHAVQQYAEKNLDEYTKSLRIRKKHQEDIRKTRAYLAEGYGDYFGDRSFCDETMSRPYEYDFDQHVEYSYPAPFLAGDCRQIEFMSNGNFVEVPSSYIQRILVRMEGIYEN